MKLFRVLSNTGTILIGSSFNKISSIALLFLLSRSLGADGFGKFSFAFFYIMLFSSMTEMGITPILIKNININEKRAREIQGKGIIIGLVSTTLAILFAWAGTYMLHYELEIRYMIFIASFSLLISFRDVTFRWILEVPFRAHLRMSYPVLLGVLSELLSLVSLSIALYKQNSIETVITVYVLSNVPGFLLLIFLSVKSLKPSFRGSNINTFDIIKEAFPIGASNIFVTIYIAIGSLILFQYKGAEQVGYYALAFRLTTSLRIIPEAMMHSVFPLLVKANALQPIQVRSIFKTTVRYGAFLAFPLAFGTMVIAPVVATLIGGESFLPAAIALSILIWATFLAFFNTILRFTFNAISLQRCNLWMSLAMVISSIILAFSLIPRYGFIGAGLSLVFSEGVGFIIGSKIALSSNLQIPLKILTKYLFASLTMVVGIWYLPNVFLQICLGIIIYLIINLMIGGLSKEEIFEIIAFKTS